MYLDGGGRGTLLHACLAQRVRGKLHSADAQPRRTISLFGGRVTHRGMREGDAFAGGAGVNQGFKCFIAGAFLVV